MIKATIRRRLSFCYFALCMGLLPLGWPIERLPAESKPGDQPAGPLSPKDEQATFRIVKGFTVDLVASEPDVVDPVAMAFDEDGRLYVVEMLGYPNEGVATGKVSSGRIKVFE